MVVSVIGHGSLGHWARLSLVLVMEVSAIGHSSPCYWASVLVINTQLRFTILYIKRSNLPDLNTNFRMAAFVIQNTNNTVHLDPPLSPEIQTWQIKIVGIK